MPCFPITPLENQLPLRFERAPAIRAMLPTRNRRQPPSSLNLSSARAKKVPRTFDRFPPPASLPPVALMPAVKSNVAKEWVDGRIKIKDFGLGRERLHLRTQSLPLENVSKVDHTTSRLDFDRDLRTCSDTGDITLARRSLSLPYPARQPSIDDVTSSISPPGKGAYRPSRRGSKCSSQSETQSHTGGQKTLAARASLAGPPLAHQRSSIELVWTSKTTAETMPNISPVTSRMRRTSEQLQACNLRHASRVSILDASGEGPLRLLMDTDLCEELPLGARNEDEINVAAELERPASTIISSPADLPASSHSVDSQESVYSRPSAFPALGTALWRRPQHSDLHSAFATGTVAKSAKPVTTLTPFLEGTPVQSEHSCEPPRIIGDSENGNEPPESEGMPSANGCLRPAQSRHGKDDGRLSDRHHATQRISSGGTLSGGSSFSSYTSPSLSESSVLYDKHNKQLKAAVPPHGLEQSQAMEVEEQSAKEDSPAALIEAPRRPEPALFRPNSQYSHRTFARSTLPSRLLIPQLNCNKEQAVEEGSGDIEIDGSQPWAWSSSHPPSPSSCAAASKPSLTSSKRPATFEAPPTFSRRRSSCVGGVAHIAVARQGKDSGSGTRTLLKPPMDRSTAISSRNTLGSRGLRLSIVLPPASSVTKKTVAVQILST